MDVKVQNLIEKISKINFHNMQSCYERYSNQNSCKKRALINDDDIKKVYYQVERKANKWVEQVFELKGVLSFPPDVLSFMKEKALYDKMLVLAKNECQARASILDERLQKINSLPRSKQLIDDSERFISDWTAQQQLLNEYFKVATSSAIKDLQKKIAFETTCLNIENEILRLKNSQNKGKNNLAWCGEVEGLKNKFSDDNLKACGNYSVYTELVEDASFSRKANRCIEYINALSGNCNFEKIFKLKEEIAPFLADLKIVVENFDKKWADRVVEANTIAQVETEKWVNEALSCNNDAKKFNLLLRAANYFNKKAMGEVGYCYFAGKGVVQDYQKAIFWLNRAINDFGLSDGDCYDRLGIMYRDGLGVAKDEKKAFDLFLQGTRCSYRAYSCYFHVAYCYLKGLGVARNDNTAYDYFNKFVSENPSSGKAAYYWLGYLKETSKQVGIDERAALVFYEKAENLGSNDGKVAAQRLRTKYEKIDLDIKIDTCFGLAQRGDATAMYELGEYYYTGIGVTVSYDDAFIWFKKAAKKGVIKAIERLGDCYFNGHGVKQNYSKAEKLYKQATKKAAKQEKEKG